MRELGERMVLLQLGGFRAAQCEKGDGLRVYKGQVTQKTFGNQIQEVNLFSQAKLNQMKTGMTEAKLLELLGPSQSDVNTGPLTGAGVGNQDANGVEYLPEWKGRK